MPFMQQEPLFSFLSPSEGMSQWSFSFMTHLSWNAQWNGFIPCCCLTRVFLCVSKERLKREKQGGWIWTSWNMVFGNLEYDKASPSFFLNITGTHFLSSFLSLWFMGLAPFSFLFVCFFPYFLGKINLFFGSSTMTHGLVKSELG